MLPEGWARDVQVDVDLTGRIVRVESDAAGVRGARHAAKGVLLPALPNLHSHSFQRGMAGLTERRGPDERDTFWTWRDTMYRFVDALTPEDVERIAAYAFMEMLESGFGSVAEFHYVHHQARGVPYQSLTELGDRVVQGAATAGIGLTLLPVLYQQGGLDGRALEGGQKRFANTPEQYRRLIEAQRSRLPAPDMALGIAPHSLRAVSLEMVSALSAWEPEGPLHIHAAEQQAEVDELVAHTGERPIEWLINHVDIDARWCVVHATQVTPVEIERLAHSAAVAGLCPETEANLGDGVFEGARFLGSGGRFGVGTDSNIRIDAPGELRQLEYSQRIRDRERAVLAGSLVSTGEKLYRSALAGGAQALSRDCGGIAVGNWADLVRIDLEAAGLDHLSEGAALDGWVFASGRSLVRDVWSAGRHMVANGRHRRRDAIAQSYRACLESLMSRI